MNVQMGDGFASVSAIIDNEPEAFLFAVASQYCRHLSGGEKKMAEEGLILLHGFAYPGDRLFRNYENVGRGLGGDVPESDGVVILINDLGRNLSRDDFLEQCHWPGSGSDLHGDAGTGSGNEAARGINKVGDFRVQLIAAAGPLFRGG